MTEDIKEDYEYIKTMLQFMAVTFQLMDVERMKAFEEKARVFANGTMTPIALHFMSHQDVLVTEKNLRNAIKVSQMLRELKELLASPDAQHQAAA